LRLAHLNNLISSLNGAKLALPRAKVAKIEVNEIPLAVFEKFNIVR
jgi:hypothetical protein